MSEWELIRDRWRRMHAACQDRERGTRQSQKADRYRKAVQAAMLRFWEAYCLHKPYHGELKTRLLALKDAIES